MAFTPKSMPAPYGPAHCRHRGRGRCHHPTCASAPCVSHQAISILLHARGLRVKYEIETRRSKMSIGMIVLVVLILALVGVIPTWSHSSSWGYGPSGGVGLLLVVVLVLVLMGRI